MKKKMVLLLAGILAGAQLVGCDVSDAKELIPDSVKETVKSTANDAASEVGEAVKGVAKDVATEAGKAVKEAAKEVAAEAGEAVKEAAKEALKDTAKSVAKETLEGTVKEATSFSTTGLLQSAEDIALTDLDGNGRNYSFIYNDCEYSAIYTTDNWQIINSYEIDNSSDMLIICQALIDVHPVHGKDLVSYRTADDMVYEWQIHNIAYAFIDDGDPLKAKCKDVDFDPKDQNLTIEEFYKSRTGKDLF